MSATENSLNEILAGCKKGDSISYERLIDLYSAKIYGYFVASSRSRDVADELLSEFYLKLIKSFKNYNDGSIDSWLFKIAYSVYYDHLRKIIRERENHAKYSEEASYQDSLGDEQPETNYDLDTALAKLDDESRNLILLRFYSDMSFKDIADTTGKPIGTVLTKIHRSMKKLKDVLERQ